jgi:hypothetical protein
MRLSNKPGDKQWVRVGQQKIKKQILKIAETVIDAEPKTVQWMKTEAEAGTIIATMMSPGTASTITSATATSIRGYTEVTVGATSGIANTVTGAMVTITGGGAAAHKQHWTKTRADSLGVASTVPGVMVVTSGIGNDAAVVANDSDFEEAPKSARGKVSTVHPAEVMMPRKPFYHHCLRTGRG